MDDFDFDSEFVYDKDINWADDEVEADDEFDYDSMYEGGGGADEDDVETEFENDEVTEDEPIFNQRASQSGMIKVILIDKDLRMGSDIVSLFEMTECISIRATQIAKNGLRGTNIDIGEASDPIVIAKMEFMQRKCPLLIKRKMYERVDKSGNIKHYVEVWDPKEMDFAKVYEF